VADVQLRIRLDEGDQTWSVPEGYHVIVDLREGRGYVKVGAFRGVDPDTHLADITAVRAQ
jgi:hypothetical protein